MRGGSTVGRAGSKVPDGPWEPMGTTTPRKPIGRSPERYREMERPLLGAGSMNRPIPHESRN